MLFPNELVTQPLTHVHLFCRDFPQFSFPNLFPFGRGSPGDPEQLTPISLVTYVRHSLRLSHRRFALDNEFICTATDVINKCKYKPCIRIGLHIAAMNWSILQSSCTYPQHLYLPFVMKSLAKGVTTTLRAMVSSHDEAVAFVTQPELHAVVKQKLNNVQRAKRGESSDSYNAHGSARAKDFVSHVEAGRKEMHGTLWSIPFLEEVGCIHCLTSITLSSRSFECLASVYWDVGKLYSSHVLISNTVIGYCFL